MESPWGKKVRKPVLVRWIQIGRNPHDPTAWYSFLVILNGNVCGLKLSDPYFIISWASRHRNGGCASCLFGYSITDLDKIIAVVDG